ncbi:MAG: ClpXP protease specificity-enhancing factor [Gammaproteobacteria bacterium]|nr:ClpXP protease specificity-enhancing factor [Gammaproteobacteria bacterium]
MPPEEIPQRPYLLRAMHAWISDNGQTPYIVVDAAAPGAEVPQQYVHDGRIVLNISYDAVAHLDLGNEFLQFQARFSGTPWRVSVPVSAVLGIYAQESGRGMIFAGEGADSPQVPPPEPEPPPPAGVGRPHLKVVK